MWYSIVITLYFISTIVAFSYEPKNFTDNTDIVQLVKDYIRPTTTKSGNEVKYYLTKEAQRSPYIEVNLRSSEEDFCLNFSKQNEKFKGPGLFFDHALNNKVYVDKKSQKTVIQLNTDCMDSSTCVSYFYSLALGLIPHVNRYDRDKYVKIDSKNIDSKNKKYFNKVYKPHTKLNNIGFDFGSFMNRDVLYKSKNKMPTYSSKSLSKYYDKMLGQRYGFSFNDVKTIYSIYCKNKPSKMKCYNGGYYNAIKNICICPRGYTYSDCSYFLPKYIGCENPKYNASRGYKTLSQKKVFQCIYEITAKQNEKVEVIVEEVNINGITPCNERNYLEIKYRKDKSVSGLKLCGNYKKIKIPALSNKVFIGFVGNENDNFKISYRSVK